MRIEQLRAEWHIEIRFVHFPLHPETPEDGITLEQLFAGRGFDVPTAQRKMRQLLTDEGLPSGDRTKTFNSRLAQELACYATTEPQGEQIHDRLFRAYFVDGINLASIDQLVEIGAGIGLNADRCNDVLVTRQFQSTVDKHWERSRNLGVVAVPTFVAGNQAVQGARSKDVLEALLKQSGARRR